MHKVTVNKLMFGMETYGYRFNFYDDSVLIKSCDTLKENTRLITDRVGLSNITKGQVLKGRVYNGIFFTEGEVDVVEILSEDDAKVFLDKYYFNNRSSKEDICLLDYLNGKEYSGVSTKFGVTIHGVDYIVKRASSKKRYDTSMFSEYVASHFINNLGYKAHDTELVKDKDGICVMLVDFTSEYGNLVHFEGTGQSSEDTNIDDKDYTYSDVLYLINKHTKISEDFKGEVINSFWNMFMLDAILGNRDRHKGNWGYTNKGGAYFMSPLYDNGSSLFPEVLGRFEDYKADRIEFLLERCEKFPASLLKEEFEGGSKRTNFYHFINNDNLEKYEGMDKSYKEFYNIGYSKVYESILKAVDNDLIPEELKKFYVEVVCCRYAHIIKRLSLGSIKSALNRGFPWNLK